MGHFIRYMYEFENCMFVTYFDECLHKELIQSLASQHNIHVFSPPVACDILYHNDEVQDILKNNLKLFFHPSSPPCSSIVTTFETNEFISYMTDGSFTNKHDV